MSGCKTDIDWAAKPEPWRSIGKRFLLELTFLNAGLLCKIPDAEILRRRRAAIGVSRAELAVRAGLSEQQVGSAERDTGSGRVVKLLLKTLGDIEREAR